VLLRPGTLARPRIEAACGERLWLPEEMPGAAPRASGTLASHYAPSAKVRLMDGKSLQAALDVLGADAAAVAVYARSGVRTRTPHYRRMPDDAAETARQLFAVLREFDAAGVKLIWIETPPDAPEWDGVRDRLHRAAAA
jgi:L-threonylcarbamoyladenylate synthase